MEASNRHNGEAFEFLVKCVRILRWPMVAVFALLLFHASIARLLDSMDSLKGHGVEISFREKFHDLNVPPDQAQKIANLNDQELDFFLVLSTASPGRPVVFQIGYLTQPEYNKMLAKLESAGLMQAEFPDSPPESMEASKAHATPLGVELRRILVRSVQDLVKGNAK